MRNQLILSENVALFKRMLDDVLKNKNPKSNEKFSSSTSKFLFEFSAEAQFYYPCLDTGFVFSKNPGLFVRIMF